MQKILICLNGLLMNNLIGSVGNTHSLKRRSRETENLTLKNIAFLTTQTHLRDGHMKSLIFREQMQDRIEKKRKLLKRKSLSVTRTHLRDGHVKD